MDLTDLGKPGEEKNLGDLRRDGARKNKIKYASWRLTLPQTAKLLLSDGGYIRYLDRGCTSSSVPPSPSNHLMALSAQASTYRIQRRPSLRALSCGSASIFVLSSDHLVVCTVVYMATLIVLAEEYPFNMYMCSDTVVNHVDFIRPALLVAIYRRPDLPVFPSDLGCSPPPFVCRLTGTPLSRHLHTIISTVLPNPQGVLITGGLPIYDFAYGLLAYQYRIIHSSIQV